MSVNRDFSGLLHKLQKDVVTLQEDYKKLEERINYRIQLILDIISEQCESNYQNDKNIVCKDE